MHHELLMVGLLDDLYDSYELILVTLSEVYAGYQYQIYHPLLIPILQEKVYVAVKVHMGGCNCDAERRLQIPDGGESDMCSIAGRSFFVGIRASVVVIA